MVQGLLIGVFASLIAALIIYVFRIKQLYVVVPNRFSSSALSETGKIAEVRILNRSRHSESKIHVALAPDADYEILASNDDGCSLDRKTLVLERLSHEDEYSVLLLVENGASSSELVTGITSSSTKGRVVKDLASVPMNYGGYVVGALLMLAFIATPIAIVETYEWFQDQEREKRIAELRESLEFDWEGLEYYYMTDFSNNYQGTEFPVHISNVNKNSGQVSVSARLINKSATPIEVRIFAKSPFDPPLGQYASSLYLEQFSVEPMSAISKEVEVLWPEKESGELDINFTLSSGKDSRFRLEAKVKIL